jgi:hypothetical protein
MIRKRRKLLDFFSKFFPVEVGAVVLRLSLSPRNWSSPFCVLTHETHQALVASSLISRGNDSLTNNKRRPDKKDERFSKSRPKLTIRPRFDKSTKFQRVLGGKIRSDSKKISNLSGFNLI